MKDFEKKHYLQGFARAADMVRTYQEWGLMNYFSNAVHCLDNFDGYYAQGYRDGISVSGL